MKGAAEGRGRPPSDPASPTVVMVQDAVKQTSLRAIILIPFPPAACRLLSVPEVGLPPPAPALESAPEMVTISA